MTAFFVVVFFIVTWSQTFVRPSMYRITQEEQVRREDAMCLTKQTYCGGVEEFPPGPVRTNGWGMRNGSTLKPLGLSTIVVAQKQKETTLWEMALLP